MKIIRNVFYKQIKWIEFIIAVVLLTAFIILGVRMVIGLSREIIYGDWTDVFNRLLSSAFSLVIGVEFVKMITKPTAGNVLEIVMFTVARFLIVEHPTMWTCFLGVSSLALLFIIRKHLFCELPQADSSSITQD